MTPGAFASLAYMSPHQVDIYLALEPHTRMDYDQGSTQAYLFRVFIDDRPQWLLAVRGTQITKPEDILVDLHVHPVAVEHIGWVHHGFYLEAQKLFEWMLEHVTQFATGPVPVSFVGHSLGGGIALITAALAGHALGDMIEPSVWTYGGPRVGDVTFRDKINRMMYHSIHRTVHNNDWVARVPPWFYHRYRHVGILLYADRRGDIRKLNVLGLIWDRVWSRLTDFGRKGFDALKDHGMTRYLDIEKRNPGFYPEYEL